MALEHAILAVLTRFPHSGYELAKKFSSVGFFWMATHQQIYRELSKLESQGWVNFETVAQVDRPNKKLYHVTELGKQELAKWIAEPSEPTAIREDLLVKVLSGYLASPTVLAQELERRRQIHQEKLQFYRGLVEENYAIADFQTLSPEAKCRYLTLRRGVRYEADWVEWCDEALQILRADLG